MPYFTISALILIAAFCLLGVLSAGRVRSSSDYTVASREAGSFAVTGIMMGSLIAGGSTVGTVQMAYVWGLSAWWFTLGSGISCIALALLFAAPMRRSGLVTLPAYMEHHFGRDTAFLTMAGSIIGTFFTIATQFLAGIALLRSVLPISQATAACIVSLTVLAFILLGGLKSFSVIGSVKTVFLYGMLLFCGFKVVSLGQSPTALIRDLPFQPWLNLFGRGLSKDVGAALSLVVGIISTQIYLQAIFAARDVRAARNGCLAAAFLVPPVGLVAVWIGLALRNMGVTVEPAQALPYFIQTYFHPAVGGLFWASLAIAVIGGASGACLGVATNLSLDVYARIVRRKQSDGQIMRANRLSVLLTIAVATCTGILAESALILQFSFLGLAFRASGVVVLMFAAALRPGSLSHRAAFAASLTGYAVMLATWAFLPQVEPLFTGVSASLATALLASLAPFGGRGISEV